MAHRPVDQTEAARIAVKTYQPAFPDTLLGIQVGALFAKDDIIRLR